MNATPAHWHRRQFLAAGGAATALGLLGAAAPSIAVASNYRALVILHLNGANDGNNVLVPTDGAYTDYEASRQNLAIPRRSLITLNGSAAGHTFGMHPALASLASLYNAGRLGFIANVGPLLEPATAAAVIANAVQVPPFLMSHSDQTSMVQGWLATEDNSGWAGRSLELMPASLRQPLAAVTMDTNRTAVLGRQSPVSFMSPWGSANWGPANLMQPATPATQAILRMARWQFANPYEAEYANTFSNAVSDSLLVENALKYARTPSADFGSDNLGRMMRTLASTLPVFKAQGFRRQVFLVHWGTFDTHANQRGTAAETQDAQLATLDKVLAAFDATNRATGVDADVATVVISEFGRTLRPGSGGGSEHAWGNHWMLLGGPAIGGTVAGTFPDLRLGGPDDGDYGKNGRLVPTLGSDQVGATLMQWLGLPASQVVNAFPYLANFKQHLLPLMRA